MIYSIYLSYKICNTGNWGTRTRDGGVDSIFSTISSTLKLEERNNYVFKSLVGWDTECAAY